MKKVLLTLILAILFTLNVPTTTHAAPHIWSKLYLAQAVPVHFYWHNNISTHFILLKNVKNVSYMLTYNTNGITEGVTGNFDPNGKNQMKKNIFLGTCSANSCIKHQNIKDIKLEIVFTYKNNHTVTKNYNISSH